MFNIFVSPEKKYLLITCVSSATDPFECAFKNDAYLFLCCINQELIKFEGDPVKTRYDTQRYAKDDDDDDDDNTYLLTYSLHGAESFLRS